MVTVAVMCPACRRVVAVGAGLPAVCFGGIPTAHRAMLSNVELDAHPDAHHDCVELEVSVADGVEGEAELAEVERVYAEQLEELGDLVRQMKPER